jgi:hypothetical protein
MCKPKGYLPPKMSVKQLDGCVLKCTPSVDIENLEFECIWKKPCSEGSPETGECLDAQSWEDHNSIVMIGCEDFDTLNRRLPDSELSMDTWPVFPKFGMKIVIPKVKANVELSLHFIVASNSLPELQDCSCWFAVDIDHEKVLECLS